jgi:regulator of protease activity HflC (stomatin/prohibitin superfamily)
MMESREDFRAAVAVSTFGLVILSGLVMLFMWGCPTYGVWKKGMDGQALLREAESSRQIAVEEAKAKKESATMLAQAEVERAKGVAEANKIIGEGLKGHEEYLRYLWIMSLEHTAQGDGTVIYVPTETNLPILEASRLRAEKP